MVPVDWLTTGTVLHIKSPQKVCFIMKLWGKFPNDFQYLRIKVSHLGVGWGRETRK